jgi:hypothetical protein
LRGAFERRPRWALRHRRIDDFAYPHPATAASWPMQAMSSRIQALRRLWKAITD